MNTETKKEVSKEKDFDYRTIKTFEDACKKVNVDPLKLPDVSMIPEDLRKPVITAYKLMIIFRAINNEWIPNWGNQNEYKYYPWYRVLSSGFGFADSLYNYTLTFTNVGSRLCTNSSEKALYIAEQFKAEYQDYFLYSE
jgi:hypothetical protein